MQEDFYQAHMGGGAAAFMFHTQAQKCRETEHFSTKSYKQNKPAGMEGGGDKQTTVFAAESEAELVEHKRQGIKKQQYGETLVKILSPTSPIMVFSQQ